MLSVTLAVVVWATCCEFRLGAPVSVDRGILAPPCESSQLGRATVDGGPVILSIVKRKGREALMTVFRFETDGDKIVHVWAYGFCPDTIRAIGEAFGLRVFTGLYRAPDAVSRTAIADSNT
jgi:hypothetical protein